MIGEDFVGRCYLEKGRSSVSLVFVHIPENGPPHTPPHTPPQPMM